MRSVMRLAAAGVLAATLGGCAVYPGGYASVGVGTGHGYGGGYGGGYYGPPRGYYAPRPYYGGGWGGHGGYGRGGWGGYGRRW